MDSSGQPSSNVIEGVDSKEDESTDQIQSKIPRPLKQVSKKKLSKDSLERPASAKLVSSLESKYKATHVKFNKELKEMLSQKEKLTTLMESMVKIRDELEDKGHKDIPALPDVPSMTQLLPRELSKSHSKLLFSSKMSFKKYRELAKSDIIRESDEDICSKCNFEESPVEALAAEMPAIKNKLDKIEETLNRAHEKQIQLESNLFTYQKHIDTVMSNLQEVESIKTNSQFLLQTLDGFKQSYNSEKEIHNKELAAKDEEIAKLRAAWEHEVSLRKALERTAEAKPSGKNVDEVINDKASEQENQPQVDSGHQDLPEENNSQKSIEEMLRNKLMMREQDIQILSRQNEEYKEKIQILEEDNDELLNQLKSYCQNYILDKENQIYLIKNRMETIVNLKNEMMSRQDRGEPFISMDVVMSINDVNALRNEVIGLHRRMNELEETGSELKSKINGKDIKIKELESELSSKYLDLEMMEGVLETMKEKHKENCQLLAKIEFSSEMILGESFQNKHGDNEKIAINLVDGQDAQRSMLADLERKLKASEDRYKLAEERRVRNEERIALLQFKENKLISLLHQLVSCEDNISMTTNNKIRLPIYAQARIKFTCGAMAPLDCTYLLTVSSTIATYIIISVEFMDAPL